MSKEDQDCLLSARAAVELNYHCLSGFNLTVVVVVVVKILQS